MVNFICDWPIIKKTLNLEMLSQNSSFYVRIECLPFGSTMYVRCEKGRTLGKGYGIKWGAIRNILEWTHWELEEHYEELIGNLRNVMRNSLETWGTLLRTWWEHKNFKNPSSSTLHPHFSRWPITCTVNFTHEHNFHPSLIFINMTISCVW
jgi:hypothetical protein